MNPPDPNSAHHPARRTRPKPLSPLEYDRADKLLDPYSEARLLDPYAPPASAIKPLLCVDCGEVVAQWGARCQRCIALEKRTRDGHFNQPEFARIYDYRHPEGARDDLHKRMADRKAMFARLGIKDDADTTAGGGQLDEECGD